MTDRVVTAEYLAKGLTCMSRVGRKKQWLEAHHGAACTAAYFFCRENKLGARTQTAIARLLDDAIARHSELFEPYPSENRDPNGVEKILQRLERNTVQFRKQGHDVIYAMHALKALRTVPDLGTTSIISGMSDLLDFIYGTEPPPENEYNTKHPLPPYDTEERMVRLTFECFMRPERLYFGPYSNVGIVHYITHADALLELARLGYGDIARKGYEAHRCHINTSGRFTPDERHRPCVRAEYGPMTHEYWEQEFSSQIIGHQFKMPDSYTRLWNRLEDRDLKTAAHDRMLHIMSIYLKSIRD